MVCCAVLWCHQVMVDTRAEAVLVPIYGVMVPLHITTVRNVNHTAEQESSAAVIRISLNFGQVTAVFRRGCACLLRLLTCMQMCRLQDEVRMLSAPCEAWLCVSQNTELLCSSWQ
jgi:hypothetical protein